LSCCGWRKGTFPDEATLNSKEIKPLAIASIELRLSEGISKGVSQLVISQSLENKHKEKLVILQSIGII